MDVEFNEPKYDYGSGKPRVEEVSAIKKLLIKMKLARTPAQTNVVMIVITILCIVLMVIFIKSAF